MRIVGLGEFFFFIFASTNFVISSAPAPTVAATDRYRRNHAIEVEPPISIRKKLINKWQEKREKRTHEPKINVLKKLLSFKNEIILLLLHVPSNYFKLNGYSQEKKPKNFLTLRSFMVILVLQKVNMIKKHLKYFIL